MTKVDKEVYIKTSDMSPEMECEAINITNQAIEEIMQLEKIKENEKLSKLCAYIKKELDNKYNPGWYVLAGKNYGTFLTHELNTFMHYSFEDIHFTIFKAV